ncbi:MAG: DUF1778 domain-containing protein [Actinobacteria bacterium]|nr:DUF1778 domain-containing protein [Actinomycetota bacterium]
MSAATARLEFRVSPQEKARIERAAELSGEQVSSFARTAAEEKAGRILREYEGATTVPAEFFDDLIAAFDTPAKANPGLRKAAKRLRATVTRD